MSFEALLFSVDDSINSEQRVELRKRIDGGDPNLEIFDLNDVQHEIDYEESYAGKLKEMLSKRVNRVFMINSPNLCKIVDEDDFTVVNDPLCDDETQNVVRNLLATEREKGKKQSKLVLLSLSNEEDQLPNGLLQIEHVCMLDNDGNIDPHKINIVIGLSRLTVQKEKEKKKKDTGCIIV